MGLFDKFKQSKFEIKPFGKVKKEDIVKTENCLMLFYQMITKNSCQITMAVQLQTTDLMKFI